MRKKILKYKAEIDEMLKNPPKDIMRRKSGSI